MRANHAKSPASTRCQAIGHLLAQAKLPLVAAHTWFMQGRMNVSEETENTASDYLIGADCVGCSFKELPVYVLGDTIKAESTAPRDVTTQLADGNGIMGYYAASKRFGTQSTVKALRHVGAIWAKRHAAPRIGVGDISLNGGGDIPGHGSHETGRDVDLRPVQKNGKEGPVTWHSPQYSRALTQELVDLLRVNGVVQVKLIFFNDPQIEGTSYWVNHDNHLHVRFHFADERPGYPIARLGMNNSPEVREMQRRLNYWAQSIGQEPIVGVDGDFGSITFAAVMAFQQHHNVTVDGIFGRDCWPLSEDYVA